MEKKEEINIFNEVFIVDGKLQEEKQKIDSYRVVLNGVYEDIMEILRDYSDLKEKDYQIIALWIIGTYFYKEFLTFPYLFLNAMKGSGKSRTLRLICSLAWNGQQIGSVTEASLFRIAGKGTLGIDEFEGIARKENQGLREILNSGYKKGMKIIRMRKKKTPDGEQQVPEEFEPFTPILLANIWGMEEVLGDRCITAILDKSSEPKYVLKLEDYDNDIRIKDVKSRLKMFENVSLVQLCSYFHVGRVYSSWNSYINKRFKYIYTNYTNYTNNTNCTNEDEGLDTTSLIKRDIFFNKIVDTGLLGRDIELFFPLFLTAHILNDEILKGILEIASQTSKDKKKEEMLESKDIQLLEFISSQDLGVYYNIKDMVGYFRNFVEYDMSEEHSNWLNPKWFGRALKRLNLIIDKRRVSSGIEVTLNVSKAKEKLKAFK